MGLRIAVLSRNFATTGGGAERYSVAVVEALAPNHEVHVFAQSISHNFSGVSYHRIPLPMRRPRWVNQLYFAAMTWWATRKGFDIVHSHENSWHGNVQTVHVLPVKHTLFVGKSGFSLAMRWLKVLTSPRLLVYLWLEKVRYTIADPRSIVLTSNSLRQVMETTYPRAQSAMKVIVPGVHKVRSDPHESGQQAARVQLGLPVDGQCILFVGNDFSKKGLATLIRALRLLPDGIFLAVVGGPGQIARFQSEAASAGVANRVFFLGALQEVDPAYTAADCLAHPSLEDTYAMVVLEAMSFGLPVVVSGPKYCGISADLKHGVHALVLRDPRSERELADSISSLLRDPGLRDRLARNALEFAGEHTWASVAQAYEGVFLNLVKKAVG